MKKRILQGVIVALVIGGVACKKKEVVVSGDPVVVEPSTVVEPEVTPKAPEPVRLSAGERTEFLGFAQYLPADIEVLSSRMNSSKMSEKVKSSKLWQAINGKQVRAAGDIDGEGVDMADELMMGGPFDMNVSDSEFTIAMGKSTGEQGSRLLKLGTRSEYVLMHQLVKSFAATMNESDDDRAANMEEALFGEFFKGLIADPESGLGLFEKMQMPSVYMAFRTTEESRGRITQQVNSSMQMFEMMGSMVEPVKTQVGGSDFSGFKLSGTKISAELEGERQEMEEFMGVDNANRFIAALAKKDIVVMSGTVGDYVVLFYGSSVDDLVFAPDVESSLLGVDALAFCDGYAKKDMVSIAYQKKEASSQISGELKGLVSEITAGLRDGLAESSELGDTRDLQALLRMSEDRWNELFALGSNEGGVTVVYLEDGLKLESCGGYDLGLIDWSARNRLASLGDGEGVLMFANTSMNPVFSAKARQYIEALTETIYAGSLKVSELPVVSPDLMVFKNQFKMVDAKFRQDLLGMWDALHGDFSDGLGGERALVVDLGGAMPPLPGIPQAVVDHGKFPRITVVAPVVNRAKMGSSWDKMNGSLTHIFGTISELSGKPLPMQQPINSEKDGFATWFIATPFSNADFMPSVTMNDQWFAASTSKNQALDLLKQAKAGGKSRDGLYVAMNFKVLDQYSAETLDLLEKNAEALKMSVSDIQEWSRYAKGLQDFDSLTVHVRREAGVLRSSVALKTR